MHADRSEQFFQDRSLYVNRGRRITPAYRLTSSFLPELVAHRLLFDFDVMAVPVLWGLQVFDSIKEPQIRRCESCGAPFTIGTGTRRQEPIVHEEDVGGQVDYSSISTAIRLRVIHTLSVAMRNQKHAPRSKKKDRLLLWSTLLFGTPIRTSDRGSESFWKQMRKEERSRKLAERQAMARCVAAIRTMIRIVMSIAGMVFALIQGVHIARFTLGLTPPKPVAERLEHYVLLLIALAAIHLVQRSDFLERGFLLNGLKDSNADDLEVAGPSSAV